MPKTHIRIFFFLTAMVAFAILDTSYIQLLSSDSLAFLKLKDKYHLLHSEYILSEQLTKYFLFLVILISIFLYQTANNVLKVKTSLAYFFLGLIMYLSESNMIHSATQPFYGAVIFPWLYVLLIKNHKRITALVVLGALSTISGTLSDFIDEFNWSSNGFADEISKLLRIFGEENFDLVGAELILLSIIYYALDPLRSFMLKNKKGVFLSLTYSVMITAGNGFLHYQYKPSVELEFLALTLVLGGFTGFTWINEKIFKTNKLFLLNTEFFYLFMIFTFIILPVVYHTNNQIMESFLLWPPALTLMGIHLLNHKKKETS